MKKTTAIIAALVVVAVFAFAGCQKQEAPKPAEQSAVTSTVTSTMPMATPEKK